MTATPTPSTTPTSTPPPTAVNTATPTLTPTRTILQKVGKLPVNIPGFILSPDGTLLAYVEDGGTIQVLNTTDWQVKWEIENTDRGMTNYTALDFSPDGSLLATGGQEQDVFVWDMNTGELADRVSEPFDIVGSVSFSPDGKLLAVSAWETYSSHYGIMVWDVVTGQLVEQFPSGDYGWYIEDAVFVPDHANLVAVAAANHRAPEEIEQEGEKPGGLYFWDVGNQQLQEALTGTAAYGMAVSPGGQLVAVYIDGNIRVWDMRRGTEVLEVKGEQFRPGYLHLTDTGILANLDPEGVVTVWNLEGETLATVGTDEPISDIAFTANDELLVAYFGKAPVEVYQLNK